MTVTGGAKAYSSTQLMSYLQTAQEQGKLQNTDLNAVQAASRNGEVDVQALQQTTNNPRLQAVLRNFIDTQDKLKMSGASTRSMELPLKAVFQTPSSAQSDRAKQTRISQLSTEYQNLNASLARVNDQLKALRPQPQSPEREAQIQQLNQEKEALNTRIRANENEVDTLDGGRRQAQKAGQNLVDQSLAAARSGQTISTDSPLGQVLGTLQREAGSITTVKGARDANSVRLQEGQTFPYAMLLTRNWSAGELNRLHATLAKIEAGPEAAGQISAQDQELLNKAGVHVKDGKLHNLLTQEPLEPQSLAELKQTTESLNSAIQDNNSVESRAIVHLRGVLNNMIQSSTELVAARENLDQLVDKLEKATATLEHETRTLAEREEELETTSTEAEVLGGRLERATTVFSAWGDKPAALFAGSVAGAVGSKASAAPPARGDISLEAKLAQTNESLAPYDMQIQQGTQAGQFTFKVADNTVSEDEFWDVVHAKLADDHATLAELNDSLPELNRAVLEQQQIVNSSKTEVDELEIQARYSQENYSRSLNEAESAQASWTKAENDPQILTVVPPSIRQSFDRVARRTAVSVAAERQNEPRINARVNTARERSNRASAQAAERLDTSRRTVQKATNRRGKVKNFLFALNHLFGRPDSFQLGVKKTAAGSQAQMQARVDREKSEVSENVARLVAEADELESRLRLVPAPEFKGVDDIAEGIEDILRQSEMIFTRLSSAENQDEEFSTRLESDYIVRVRENNDYHTRKLSERSEVTRAETAQRAADALRHLRSSLFVAQAADS